MGQTLQVGRRNCMSAFSPLSCIANGFGQCWYVENVRFCLETHKLSFVCVRFIVYVKLTWPLHRVLILTNYKIRCSSKVNNPVKSFQVVCRLLLTYLEVQLYKYCFKYAQWWSLCCVGWTDRAPYTVWPLCCSKPKTFCSYKHAQAIFHFPFPQKIKGAPLNIAE